MAAQAVSLHTNIIVAIDQRLLEDELRGVIARLRDDEVEAFAWFESVLYLKHLERARAAFVMYDEGVMLDEFNRWQKAFHAIPADRRLELVAVLNTFRSANPTTT